MKTFFLTQILLISWSFASYSQDWVLERDQSEVQIFTRKVPNSGLKEFKAQTTLKCTKEQGLALLRNVKNYSVWMHQTTDSKPIGNTNGTVFYAYLANIAPWPVKDRDNILKNTVLVAPNKITIEMEAEPNLQPEYSGRVRIKYLKGYWSFEDLGNGTCRVTQQVHADPGGNLPQWLVNSAVIDNPLNTLLGFRRQFKS